MALRQFASKSCRQLWPFLRLSTGESYISSVNKGSALNSAVQNLDQEKCYLHSKYQVPNLSSSFLLKDVTKESFSPKKDMIDLFTNNLYKRLYMPTITMNNLKVYEGSINISKSILDPLVNNIKINDLPVPGQIQKKEAVRMIRIRRRKMRKHKLRKLRKRMKFVFEKIRLKRELRKEQEFRTELLTQVEAADKYDAKAYVEGILHTLRYHPKPPTVEEIKEKYRQLTKINRYNTDVVRPRFDD